jgi:hypothetical protein
LVNKDPRKLAGADLSLLAAHLLGELYELSPGGLPKWDEPLDCPARVRGAPASRTQTLRYMSAKLQEIEGAAARKIGHRDDAAGAERSPYSLSWVLVTFSHRQTP